ncbi:Cytochrome P450 [Pyrenophora tritici-repentis]|nr:Cytochrome P450 [Pyrenophora tritici-repentis]
MYSILAATVAVAVIAYLILQVLLHGTQSKEEPCLLETRVPFFDSAIGILRHGAGYLSVIRSKHGMPILTLRMPFQRLYVVYTPSLIRTIQSKANATILVPNLLDFGMLFSGLNKNSQKMLRKAFKSEGNGFTTSVHKYLLSGSPLNAATRSAVDRLSASLPNDFFDGREDGLMALVQHQLTLAMTGSIYGPENPYDDPDIETSWRKFVPGIKHLLYSPFPFLTARKAMRARSRVIAAFRKYFAKGGHLEAFPMVAEMHRMNMGHGLSSDEAAKMEMATSLAMLSSGAVTVFWLIFHILSNENAVRIIREELHAVASDEPETSDTAPKTRVFKLNSIKEQCPTLVAMLHETLRYHSTVINIKQVQQDTKLADQYLFKKDAVIMIPGQSIHHNTDIWGSSAIVFDHTRFLSASFKKNLASTSAFRPFGAGATMCPGRHFSTNVILSLVAMVVLQYDVLPAAGQWAAPTKRNADLWNAMPKPDWDVNVKLVKRAEEKTEWKFVWDDTMQV